MEPSYPEELNHIFLQQGKSSLILSFGKNQEQNKNMWAIHPQVTT